MIFNMMSQGKDVLVIAEMQPSRFDPTAKERMEEFAKRNGITNGQLTREQFTNFMSTRQAKFTGTAPPGGPRMQTPGGPAAPGSSQAASLESMNQWADADFKRYDQNADGKLNKDEVPEELRKDFTVWDKNGDGVIEQSEYRVYFVARLNSRPAGTQQANPIMVLIEDDILDKRPVVYRAGKLPEKGLPPWFKEIDYDNDGQVSFYEWRKAEKTLADFAEWDRDDDGFITPTEALGVHAANTKGSGGEAVASMADMFRNKGKGGGGGFNRGGGGGGGNPWGNFFKGGQGNGGGGNQFGGPRGNVGGGGGGNGKGKGGFRMGGGN